MTDRFRPASATLAGALQHWRDGIGMLSTPADWLLGKGAGRFPQELPVPACRPRIPRQLENRRTGRRTTTSFFPDHATKRDSAKYSAWRSGFRSCPAHPIPSFSMCAPTRLRVCISSCAKGVCSTSRNAQSRRQPFRQQASHGSARFVSLDGAKFNGGPWYAPRPVFFAMAIESPGTRVVIDNVSLIGPDGRELLVNGNFAARHGPLVHDQRSFPPSMAHQEHRFELVVRPGNDRLAAVRCFVLWRALPTRRGCRAGTPVRAISRGCIGRISAGGTVRQPPRRTPPRISLLPAAYGEPGSAKRHAAACKLYKTA